MGNFYMESTQINYRRDETLKTVDQKLQELSQESAIDTDIAPVFKSTNTYQPGDLVYYRNKLYVFNVEHTGAWAAGDVTATDVSTAMNTSLSGKADYADIAGDFNSETVYTAGDLVIYNGIIYRCTNNHTGDWDADDFSATTIGAELSEINSNITSLNNKLPANCSMLSAFGTTLVIHGSYLAVALIAATFGGGGKAGFYTYTANPDTLQIILDCGATITAVYSSTDQTITFTSSTDVAWLAMFG